MATEFGKKLRELRERKKETQSELANFLGVSTRQVQRWEDNGLPRPEKIRELNKHYGYDFFRLLGGDTGSRSESFTELNEPEAEYKSPIAQALIHTTSTNKSLSESTRILAESNKILATNNERLVNALISLGVPVPASSYVQSGGTEKRKDIEELSLEGRIMDERTEVRKKQPLKGTLKRSDK